MMSKKKEIDPFLRGQRGSSLPGKLIMLVGRSLDVALQAYLLSSAVLQPVFSAIGLPHLALSFPGIAISKSATILRLPIPRLLLISAGALQGLKQIYWAWFLSLDIVRPNSGLEVSAINAFMETVFATLYLCTTTSSSSMDEKVTPVHALGFAVFATGLFLEWVSEIQRRRFKDNPSNKGRLFTGGLFGYARHINYAGFLMGRAGHAMIASGWILGTIVGLLFWLDLGGRGVRVMDNYCTGRVRALTIPTSCS